MEGQDKDTRSSNYVTELTLLRGRKLWLEAVLEESSTALDRLTKSFLESQRVLGHEGKSSRASASIASAPPCEHWEALTVTSQLKAFSLDISAAKTADEFKGL
eukprot:681672-Amphidinium_carterae.2